MYGGIGDILRGYARRRKADVVNHRGIGVRRETVWLPETNTDPNSRMENFAREVFSRLLTKMIISKMPCFPMEPPSARRKGNRCRMAAHDYSKCQKCAASGKARASAAGFHQQQLRGLPDA